MKLVGGEENCDILEVTCGRWLNHISPNEKILQYISGFMFNIMCKHQLINNYN